MFHIEPESWETTEGNPPDNAPTSKPTFESLEAFSEWMDDQLILLEENNKDFATTKSIRRAFNRT
jgi:hypothetical protein